jgi:hypothetical protein
MKAEKNCLYEMVQSKIVKPAGGQIYGWMNAGKTWFKGQS